MPCQLTRHNLLYDRSPRSGRYGYVALASQYWGQECNKPIQESSILSWTVPIYCIFPQNTELTSAPTVSSAANRQNPTLHSCDRQFSEEHPCPLFILYSATSCSQLPRRIAKAHESKFLRDCYGVFLHCWLVLFAIKSVN